MAFEPLILFWMGLLFVIAYVIVPPVEGTLIPFVLRNEEPLIVTFIVELPLEATATPFEKSPLAASASPNVEV